MSDPVTLPPQNIRWVDRLNLFFHYRRYLKMLGRRWPIIFLTCAAGAGIMAYRAVKSPNIYQASSRIGVAPRISTKNAPNGAVMVEELNYFYDNQIAMMKHSDVLSQVDFDLKQNGFTNRPAYLRAEASRDKGNLVLSVRSTEFPFAVAYSKYWAKAFIDFKNQQRERLVGQTAKTTREEMIKFERRLKTAREALWDFTKKWDIDSIKEMGDANLKRLDERQEEYQNLKTMLQRLEGKSSEDLAKTGVGDVVRTTKQDGPDGKNSVVSEKIDPLEKFLNGTAYKDLTIRSRELMAQKKELEQTLKPSHPYLVSLNDEFVAVTNRIQYELDMIAERKESRIKSLKLDIQSLEPVIEELRKKVRDSQDIRNEFARLKEEETLNKTTIEKLRLQLQDLELSPVDESQFDILAAGEGYAVPVEPNRPKMIMSGLLAGLLLGIGLIYFLDKMDDRLELAEDIEAALDEPVLGQLPEVPETTREGGALLVTELDEHNMFAESIRGVRSAVLLGFRNEKKKVLIITSAVPGDGKTTFTTNFAITLAIAGHRVLLVDADLRRGNTHSFFRNNRDPGFTDILLGEQHWTDVMRGTPIETLKVIHSGKLPPNPGELLISQIPAQLVQEAKEEFDFIIFDCPPLTAIDDTFSLAPLSDGVLFVVRSAQTSMRFAKTSLHSIRQRGAQVLGLVLNGITPDNPYYYYQRYYHGYYVRGENKPSTLASSPMPVQKMAPAKSRRSTFVFGSIEQEARAFSKNEAAAAAIAFEEKVTKAAVFKAKRQARKEASQSSEPSKDTHGPSV